LAIQTIYVVYLVAFPLISNTQAGGPAADLEILMRGFRWFAPIYTIDILLLYYLFWQAMQLVAQNLWRWWLRALPWGKFGPLSPYYWNYWTIVHRLCPGCSGFPCWGR